MAVRSTKLKTGTRARTKPRVEETEPKSSVRKNATHRGSQQDLTIEGGEMLIEYQGSELVPVAQYASVTIGPVRVVRKITDPGDDHEALKAEIHKLRKAVEEVISEDRFIVEESVRMHNEREGNGKK